MRSYRRPNNDTNSDSIVEDKTLAVGRHMWVPTLLTRLDCSGFRPETPAVDDQRVAYAKGTNKGSPTDMTMVELHGLAKFFPWPNGVKLRLPCTDGGSLANYPGCVVVYEDFMKAGFRLPLHPFICDFLSDTKLCPAQLTPNAWRSILAFLLKFKELNRVPSYEAFQSMYKLKVQKKVFYSVIFQGFNLISLPKCADSWDKKWFLVCESEEFHFNCPMYTRTCKVRKIKTMITSHVANVIEIFKKLSRKDEHLNHNKILDPSQLEEAGLSIPHHVKEPNKMYVQYVTKRKRDAARIMEGPSNKKFKTCVKEQAFTESKQILALEEEEEEDPQEESEERDDDDDDDVEEQSGELDEEEDPKEEEDSVGDGLEGESEEMSSVGTLCRPEVLTALAQLPELLLAAQSTQGLKRKLSESIRELGELKKEKFEFVRRERELIEKLASQSEEIDLLQLEKKNLLDELTEVQSLFMEVTQKARECVEISSSALKVRVPSTRN